MLLLLSLLRREGEPPEPESCSEPTSNVVVFDTIDPFVVVELYDPRAISLRADDDREYAALLVFDNRRCCIDCTRDDVVDDWLVDATELLSSLAEYNVNCRSLLLTCPLLPRDEPALRE
jgi:hypothetical protein